MSPKHSAIVEEKMGKMEQRKKRGNIKSGIRADQRYARQKMMGNMLCSRSRTAIGDWNVKMKRQSAHVSARGFAMSKIRLPIFLNMFQTKDLALLRSSLFRINRKSKKSLNQSALRQ